jgi:hypothetical protein
VSDIDHQRARMGVPVDTRIDADGNPMSGPWQHTCKLPGLINGRQAKPCLACAEEAEQP